MFRTSSLIALALGVTTLGSTIEPAAAMPSVHFGGAISLPSRVPSVVGAASMRPSSQGLRMKPSAGIPSLPVAGPHPGSKPIGLKVPTSVGNAGAGPAGQTPSPLKVPVGQTSPGPIASQKPQPLKVPMPGPSNPPAPSPTPNGGNQNSPSGSGPVVILAPQIPLGTGVALATPVPLPVAANTTAAQPGPTARPVAGICATGKIPALGAAIDELLPTAQLSEDAMAKVTEMRELIRDLAANGRERSARDLEEAAMQILGYSKLWLRCGYGTFTWIKQVSASQPAQPQ